MTKPTASLLEVNLPEVEEAQDFALRQVASGQQLAQARSAAGLAAETIAERLRLSTDQVLALEAERWEQLPDLTFVRAILRAYARQIDVDVAPLIDHVGGFAQATVLQPYAADVSGSEHSRGRSVRPRTWRNLLPGRGWVMTMGAVASLVLVGGFVVLLLSGESQIARTVQAVPIPGVSNKPMQAAPAGAPGAPSGLRGLQPAEGMTPIDALPVTIRDSGSMMNLRDYPAPAPAAPAIRTTSTEVQPAANAGQTPVFRTAFPVQMPDSEPVHVHFSKRSWVNITHKDGVNLLTGTQNANQSFRLDGTPPMDVNIGNPAGVTIEFRGRTVDLQSKINSKGSAHFTLN